MDLFIHPSIYLSIYLYIYGMELSRFGFLCAFCLYLAKMVNMCNTMHLAVKTLKPKQFFVADITLASDQTHRKKIREFQFRQLAPKTPSLLSRPRIKTFPTQPAHILLPICMCCFLWLPTMEPLHDGNLKIKFLCVSFQDFLFQTSHWKSNLYIRSNPTYIYNYITAATCG